MKNWAIPAAVLFVGALVISGSFAGCGSSNSSNSNWGATGGQCFGSGCSSASSFTYGDTENLKITSLYALESYAGMPLGNPTNIVVNLNLNPVQQNPPIFLGTLSIQYNDGAVLHQGTFANGTSTAGYRSYQNTVSTLVGSTYRLFFEDAAGAVIVTIAQPTGGDTQLSTTGQVWFYNFNPPPGACNPLYQPCTDNYGMPYEPGLAWCWMVDLGPFDCRNFNVPPSSSYTSAGTTVPAFSLLGTLPTVNVHAALGI